MTTTSATLPSTTTPENTSSSINVQRVYLKGTSLEIPNAPNIFLQQNELTLDLSVTPHITTLATDVYEVNLRTVVTAKNSDGSSVMFARRPFLSRMASM